MKLKAMESVLQQFEAFKEPQVSLEQYATPPKIASQIVLHLDKTQFKFEDKLIADFGSGTGILSAGAILQGCFAVFCFEKDAAAMLTAKRNFEKFGFAPELILIDVAQIDRQKRLFALFDNVVMNPPFGTRLKGIDLLFVKNALLVTKDSVYSLHKSSTRKVFRNLFSQPSPFFHRKLKNNAFLSNRWLNGAN
ncbi:hypothetical protein MHBO_000795 [Bonamia ostreae]|uniref:Methyltransferase-like protein 5 n=1 Tax=Bonamia ostreae TaxID=126728 RepID=A0ABV2AGY3_9EUKA